MANEGRAMGMVPLPEGEFRQHFNAAGQQMLEKMRRDDGCMLKKEMVDLIVQEGGTVYQCNNRILDNHVYGEEQRHQNIGGLFLEDENYVYREEPMTYTRTIVVDKDKKRVDIKTPADTIEMFDAGALYLTNKRLIISSVTKATDTVVTKQPRIIWNPKKKLETYIQDKVETQKLTMQVDPHDGEEPLRLEGKQYTIQSWRYHGFHFFGIPLRNIIHTQLQSLSGAIGEGNVWKESSCECCPCFPCCLQLRNDDTIFTTEVNNRILKIGVLFPPWEEKRNMFVILDKNVPLINIKSFVGKLEGQTEENRVPKYENVVLNINSN